MRLEFRVKDNKTLRVFTTASQNNSKVIQVDQLVVIFQDLGQIGMILDILDIQTLPRPACVHTYDRMAELILNDSGSASLSANDP